MDDQLLECWTITQKPLQKLVERNLWECHIFQYSKILLNIFLGYLTQISQLLTEDEHSYWGGAFRDDWGVTTDIKDIFNHTQRGRGWVFSSSTNISFSQLEIWWHGTVCSVLAMLALGRLDGEPFHNHSCSEFKIPPIPASSSSSSRPSASPWNPSPLLDKNSGFTSWNTSIFTWHKN